MKFLSVLSGIPIFLIIFVSSVISIQIMLRRNKNGFKDIVEDFMEKEKRADMTIKRNLTDLPYVTADKSALPVKEYPDLPEYEIIKKKQNTCLKKTELEMIYLDDEYSNTDLKLKYGKNNLDRLTCLEAHYNGYIRALLEWANELIKLENKEDARLVLEEAVRMKADVSKVYIKLADIYSESKDYHALSRLKENAKAVRLNFKEKTISYIDDKIG